jgi:MoaD family protein
MKVRVFGTLRSVVGDHKEIEVHAGASSTARALLDQLIVVYPGLRQKIFREGERLEGGVGLFVNGRSIRFLDGLDTPVQEGDELALFPPVGGG